jgi:hypothetical protein
MRLNTYIAEGRSQQIPKEDAIELLKTKHSDAYKSKFPIYRGIKGSSLPFLYTNPDAGEPRQSANTYNYYTLIMDNTPAWKNYPKRSRSLICTTDIDYSTVYGSLPYIVYPENGAKIGVCPTDDIWGSFSEFNGRVSMTLDDMNDCIRQILDVYDLHPKIVTYGSLIRNFEFIDDEKHTNKVKQSSYYKHPSRFEDVYVAYLESNKTFLKFMEEDVLDPKRNKFNVVKSGDDLPLGREVWVGGPCVLVRNDYEIK